MKYIPHVPSKIKKGFMRKILLSVTNEINTQIRELKICNKKPALIRLGKYCSIRFAYEQNNCNINISQAPPKYLGIPVDYNNNIIGVFVENERAPP